MRQLSIGLLVSLCAAGCVSLPKSESSSSDTTSSPNTVLPPGGFPTALVDVVVQDVALRADVLFVVQSYEPLAP